MLRGAPRGDPAGSTEKQFDDFDYGYALTVHKAQGSQWDDVVLFDESLPFKEPASAGSIPAVTRAAERLTVVV